ncbi:RILP-like protein 1 isoform X2 [Esox lucius]|uniref:RILP-like protein 1 isoform X2 n=1 Tax=Esox lucius TaxID=8010 RepID=UPI000577B1BA|nr:RILP-like protein 1 isoform X2 [Esox lucius]
MEKVSDTNDRNGDVKRTEGCFERTFSILTVDDVYEIAKSIGSEVEKLIDGYGKESATGLVPKIVKVLELLESFASRNHAHKSKEEELLKAFETLQVQQQKKPRVVKECEESSNNNDIQRELQQEKEEEKQRRRCEELQAQVLQLQTENQELHSRLRGSHAQEDRIQRQEREVMLKLKEVVDKQRDELRAKVQEITTLSKEVEALQEQLERFMKMNGELRHKQSIVTAQVKSAVERKAEMEADLREKQKEIEHLSTQLEKAHSAAGTASPCQVDLTDKLVIDLKDPNRPCFTKQEVREMLSERNELKANLFLVQEELSYYQREILNDERCPGFLLEAVRSAIKKQKTVIKAKMLGRPEDECSSDEERGPLFERRAVPETETDSKPQESRIRNLFGFLTRSASSHSSRGASENHTASSWEIIDDVEAHSKPDP